MALFNIGGRRGGGMSPLMLALLGVLAYRTLHGKGRLADMLGMHPEGQAPGAPGLPQTGTAPTSGGLGGLLSGGGLGGLLGGVLGGGALSGGLQDLLNQFRQSGHGDKADSWVSTGANKPVSPQELEQVLGNDRIDWLTRETGMSREQLLSGLSRELPQAVDKLTPNGNVPSDSEMQKIVSAG